MKKIFGIDIFRGGAAFLVFCFHYWTFFPQSSFFDSIFLYTVFSAGHLGVDMFFVLSGFLVSLSVFRSENFFCFMEKRIRRILPLAWGIVILIFLYNRSFSKESMVDFFVHLFFLQGFFTEFYHSLNPVMWTLSIEMLFYVFLAFVFFVIAKKNVTKLMRIFFVFVILSFLWRAGVFYFFANASPSEKIFLSEQLWGRFDQFFLGIFLAFIWKFPHKIYSFFPSAWKEQYLSFSSVFFSSLVSSRYFLSLFLFLGSVIFLGSYFLFSFLGSDFRDILWMQIFLHFLVGFGFFCILFCFLFFDFSRLPLVCKKLLLPFLFLGEISYGVYLFHFPLLALSHRIPFFLASPEIAFFVVLIITLFLSWISYQFFEKPFLLKK